MSMLDSITFSASRVEKRKRQKIGVVLSYLFLAFGWKMELEQEVTDHGESDVFFSCISGFLSPFTDMPVHGLATLPLAVNKCVNE